MVCLPVCLFLTLTQGAASVEWVLGLCKKLILINFAWGKQEAERGPAES